MASIFTNWEIVFAFLFYTRNDIKSIFIRTTDNIDVWRKHVEILWKCENIRSHPAEHTDLHYSLMLVSNASLFIYDESISIGFCRNFVDTLYKLWSMNIIRRKRNESIDACMWQYLYVRFDAPIKAYSIFMSTLTSDYID